MTITYGNASNGASCVNVTASPFTFTSAYTAGAGENVYFGIVQYSTTPPANVKFNGTPLTLVDKKDINNTPASGCGYVYEGVGLGTGSPANFSWDVPATTHAYALWGSYKGVGGVTTTIRNYGSGKTNQSSGTVTLTAGQLALCFFFGVTSNAKWTSLTGGTQRGIGFSDSGSYVSAVFGDSSSSTTFLANSNNNEQWSSVVLVLDPPKEINPVGNVASSEAFGSATVTPGAVEVAPTAIPTGEGLGTPIVSDAANLVAAGIGSVEAFGATTVKADPLVAATGIPSTEALGAPKVWLQDQYVSPAGAASREAFGTASLNNGPLSLLRADLEAGRDTVWLALGDSTDHSAYDTGYSTLTNPWTPGTLFGWVGREALAWAQYYDATVKICYWNYPTNTGYTSLQTLRSGSGPSTITVYLGGWPGATMATYILAPAEFLPPISPSLITMQDGFNEPNTTLFTSWLTSYLPTLQSAYPGVPLLFTTANATTIANESGHQSFALLWGAMLGVFFTGVSQPMSPPLQASTKVPGVWVLDTAQAKQTAGDLYSDGLHPIGSGFGLQAAFMLRYLANDIYTALLQQVSPSGIASGEAFGTAVATISLRPTGIASDGAFGTATVNPGAVTILPAGIASAQAFGSFGAVSGPVALADVGGIDTAVSFGTAVVSPGPVSVSPAGGVSAEGLGEPIVTIGTTRGIRTVSIVSGEAFGQTHVIRGPTPPNVGVIPVHVVNVVVDVPITKVVLGT